MKVLFAAILLLAIPVTLIAEGETAEDLYYQAFKAQVREVFSQLLTKTGEYGRPGDRIFEAKVTAIVDGMAKCHTEGMRNFEAIHVRKAYNAVANGGTYADAKMAFETSLAISAATGGEAKEIVDSAVKRSAEQGKVCVSAVMQ